MCYNMSVISYGNWKLKPDEAVDEFIFELFSELVETEEEPDKKGEFRSSSFPYCPILNLEALVYGDDFVPGYNSGFFTGVGTAIHENLQFWFPRLHRFGYAVWGDWECQNHNCKNIIYGCSNPKVCPICGSEQLKYREIEFTEEEHGVSGHVDMVLYVAGKFVIIDFKSGGFYLFEKGDGGKLPYTKNIAQISNYMVMFERKYKIRPHSWVLAYVPRENPKSNGFNSQVGPHIIPKSHKWTQLDFDLWSERLDRASKGRRALMNMLAAKDETSHKKWRQRMIAARPCRKVMEYENYLDWKYYGDNKCKHYVSGKCSIKSAVPNYVENRVKYLNRMLKEESKK